MKRSILLELKQDRLQNAFKEVNKVINIIQQCYHQNKLKMGQKSLSTGLASSSGKFNEREWIIQNSKQGNNYLGHFQTVKHIISNRKLDRYTLSMKSIAHFNRCWQMFLWRKNRQHIQKAYFFVPEEINDICLNKKTGVDLYLEHVSWRLSQIKDIPFPQNIYCVKAMLKGFFTLFCFFGGFKICQEQICIDTNGQVSVWYNSNIANPEKQLIEQKHDIKQVFRSRINTWNEQKKQEIEQYMVNQIMKITINNTDTQTEPKPSLEQYFESFKLTHKATFEGTIKLIDEYFQVCKLSARTDAYQQLVIPNKLLSIILLNKMKQTTEIALKNSNKMAQKMQNPSHTERTSIKKREKNVPRSLTIGDLMAKRPTTYCQSLPNRHQQGNLYFKNNQLLQKNKSSENFQKIILQELPLARTKRHGISLSPKRKNNTERIYSFPQPCIQNGIKRIEPMKEISSQPKSQFSYINNYQNYYPLKVIEEYPFENKIIRQENPERFVRNQNSLPHMPDPIRNTPQNKNGNDKTLNQRELSTKQKAHPLKVISQTCRNTQQNPQKNYFPQRKKHQNQPNSRSNILSMLPKVTSSKPPNKNHFYFSSNGSKLLIDSQIAEDLQLYNI